VQGDGTVQRCPQLRASCTGSAGRKRLTPMQRSTASITIKLAGTSKRTASRGADVHAVEIRSDSGREVFSVLLPGHGIRTGRRRQLLSSSDSITASTRTRSTLGSTITISSGNHSFYPPAGPISRPRRAKSHYIAPGLNWSDVSSRVASRFRTAVCRAVCEAPNTLNLPETRRARLSPATR
jgi:hypothetical protein